MKNFGIILTIVSILLITLSSIYGIKSMYKYDNEFAAFWSLADKSSTIANKAKYVDKFVEALEKGGFEGEYNAIMYKTLDNQFDTNLEALKTLQQRLHEIEKMDITSFEYQTAIQQITGQEQGEAQAMLSVFQGIWYKENYFLLWNWIGVSQIVLSFILLCAGGFIWADNSY